ncbi:MAG: cytochrome d ubiquinol oxidase subunit II, partial [Candidatus Regiella insecticola]|nr:cytochrome d ubiquinol oxidase subunit II [Candidatus Regiella insecticola]
YINSYLRLFYTGDFFQLLNPLGLLASVVSLAMLVTQGATYLQMRTRGEFYLRSCQAAQISALIMSIAFLLAGIWV